MTTKPQIILYDLAIQITSAFEGSTYSTVTGNFDGQGISGGVLQWNLGQGTFQNFILNHINPMHYDYFPVPIDRLTKISSDAAVTWAKDVMLYADGSLKPEWRKAWQRFLSEPSVINVQKRAIDPYWHQAKTICSRLQMDQTNARAMCFSFDVAVQNWSLGDINLDFITKDQAYNCLTLYGGENAKIWIEHDLDGIQQKLVVAAHLRALKANPKFRADVFTRKATIAVGEGIVHGTHHKLNKLFK